MARKARQDSVVEKAAERHLSGPQTVPRKRGRALSFEELVEGENDVRIVPITDLKEGDRIFEGRRGGKVKFVTVKEIHWTRKRVHCIVNKAAVYDGYLARVPVMI